METITVLCFAVALLGSFALLLFGLLVSLLVYNWCVI